MTKRAVILFREGLQNRRALFENGLRAAGYEVVGALDTPAADDVMVMWNRYGTNDLLGRRLERAGGKVVVLENGYLGKTWKDATWFAMSLGQHAGGGTWNVGSADRWDSLDVELKSWRDSKPGETIILAQRGIGSPSVRSPDGWHDSARDRFGGRIRAHPGKKPPKISLEEDLRYAARVVTWASTAALQALMMGIPVWYEYPHWIGGKAAQPTTLWGKADDLRDSAARLEMFRSLIWAMWRESEVESGEAFDVLLNGVKPVHPVLTVPTSPLPPDDGTLFDSGSVVVQPLAASVAVEPTKDDDEAKET